ncbi:MAG TPA: NAD(P)/FAD-dependent oxidoreductase [Sneathiellales bacterium]|jgi:diapolycopene oxygenase|nr:NAD(P)/FAD-dependent oxidoreductase [Sneathiellales bacterium]
MKTVVIGGGMAGMSAAWTLRKNRHEVVLLEKNEDAGAGAAHSSGTGYVCNAAPRGSSAPRIT